MMTQLKKKKAVGFFFVILEIEPYCGSDNVLMGPRVFVFVFIYTKLDRN